MLIDTEGIAYELFEIVNLLVAFDGKVEQDTPLARIKRHPKELLLNELYLWDGQ